MRFATIDVFANSEDEAMAGAEWLAGDGWRVSHADILDPADPAVYTVTIEREF